MSWDWILEYSSFFITGAVSLGVGWLLNRLTTRLPDLIYYTSHLQLVRLPRPEGVESQDPQPQQLEQQVIPLVGMFRLLR